MQNQSTHKECTRCGEWKHLSEYHKHKGGRLGLAASCKVCSKLKLLDERKKNPERSRKWARDRQRNLKQLALKYKGSKCSVCGYHKCFAALEFHHMNPLKKDFKISQRGFCRKNLTDKVKVELDKCIVVCSNCHREIHHANSV